MLPWPVDWGPVAVKFLNELPLISSTVSEVERQVTLLAPTHVIVKVCAAVPSLVIRKTWVWPVVWAVLFETTCPSGVTATP
jgi:hypothetical protein